MTKSVKWSLTAAIVVFIAALAFYPDIKRKFQGSKDEVPMSPSGKGGGRNQVLNVNAEVVEIPNTYG
jgi:membrane fusion protein (multidrug efflux system)